MGNLRKIVAIVANFMSCRTCIQKRMRVLSRLGGSGWSQIFALNGTKVCRADDVRVTLYGCSWQDEHFTVTYSCCGQYDAPCGSIYEQRCSDARRTVVSAVVCSLDACRIRVG
jgi:hypothetical protein